MQNNGSVEVNSESVQKKLALKENKENKQCEHQWKVERTSFLAVISSLKRKGSSMSSNSAAPEGQGELALLLLTCSQLPAFGSGSPSAAPLPRVPSMGVHEELDQAVLIQLVILGTCLDIHANQPIDRSGFQVFSWGQKNRWRRNRVWGEQEGRWAVRSPLGNLQSWVQTGQDNVARQSVLAFSSFFSLRSSDGKHNVFILLL